MKNFKLNLSLMVLTLLSFSFFGQSAHAYFQSQRGDAVGGVLLQTNNGTEWGRWGEPRFCPENTYVNGFSLKVERHQGSDDDTALNNIKFNCSSSYQEMIQHLGFMQLLVMERYLNCQLMLLQNQM